MMSGIVMSELVRRQIHVHPIRRVSVELVYFATASLIKRNFTKKSTSPR